MIAQLANVAVVAIHSISSIGIVGASYGRSLRPDLYASLDARYSRGRGAEPDVGSLRGMLSWNLSPVLSFNGEVSYERDGRGDNVGTLLTLTYRFDRRSSLRADFDLDLFTTGMWLGHLIVWLPWAAIGAALGARRITAPAR